MRKMTVVIGQSASGKTTFITETFLADEVLALKTKPFKHTEIVRNNVCLLGDYTTGVRCLGTDTLSMSVLPQLIEFLQENHSRYRHVIADGDRITNARFFNFIASLKIPVDLYVFSCSLAESVRRREATGSAGSEQFVKTTQTKAVNMRALGKRLGFNVIDKYTGKHDGVRKGIQAFI